MPLRGRLSPRRISSTRTPPDPLTLLSSSVTDAPGHPAPRAGRATPLRTRLLRGLPGWGRLNLAAGDPRGPDRSGDFSQGTGGCPPGPAPEALPCQRLRSLLSLSSGQRGCLLFHPPPLAVPSRAPPPTLQTGAKPPFQAKPAAPPLSPPATPLAPPSPRPSQPNSRLPFSHSPGHWVALPALKVKPRPSSLHRPGAA